MFQFPPIPSWDALHPMIIHFPIALLLISPLFIFLGALLRPGQGRPYQVAAMALLLMGTAGTFVAVESGEAAAELTERSPGAEQVLHTHEALAERTRAMFTVLSIIFLALLVVPPWLKQSENRLTATILPLAFLVFYGAGVLLLLNTAHNGGRLVHEFGAHDMLFTPTDTSAAIPAEREHERD